MILSSSSSSTKPTEKEIIEFCRGKLPKYMVSMIFQRTPFQYYSFATLRSSQDENKASAVNERMRHLKNVDCKGGVRRIWSINCAQEMLEAPLKPKANREKMTQIMFETLASLSTFQQACPINNQS